MIMYAKGYLVDVDETPSKKDENRKFLNGKLKTSLYEWKAINVGIRIAKDDLFALGLDKEHKWAVDVDMTWKDGKPYTHVTIAGCVDEQ